jgi:hypothetical protein
MTTVRCGGTGTVPVRVEIRENTAIRPDGSRRRIFAIYIAQTKSREVRITKWFGEERISDLEKLFSKLSVTIGEVNTLPD